MFVETAQALALRVLRDVPSDDNARLRYAFKLCLSRDPDAGERDTLASTLARRIDPAQAKEILPPDAPAGIDPMKYAAWFGVSRILLNLDETITRE